MNKRSFWLAAAAGLGAAGLARFVWSARARGDGRAPAGGTDNAPHVVILGAGFAGLSAARSLQRRVGAGARITLVDRHNYHLFTPMLYQVATWGLDPYDTAYPLRQLTGHQGIDFRKAMVTGVDFEARQVELGNQRLDYDYLVVALGSTTNYFGNQAAEQHSFPLKWLEDGVEIRNHVIDMLEQATTAPTGDERRALLTFVIVGGGATGVEAAASLADLLHEVIPSEYPAIRPDETRIVVVEAEGKLLGHMGGQMSAGALRHLRNQRVDVWLNAKAKEIGEGYLRTEDGRTLNTRTVLWSTGVRAPDVVSSMQAEHGKGGSLAVDEYLQVKGHPGVFACGDDSHYEDPRTHRPVPLLAQSAADEGRAVADNLARLIAGQELRPFHYRSLGEAVSLGRFAGVIKIGEHGPLLDGVAGWLGWRVVHLARITSFRNKAATVLDWGVGYLYDLNTARLEIEPMPGAAKAD